MLEVYIGVNFINVKNINFMYECCFGSFYYLHVTRKKAAKVTFVRKICVFNVDEIDYRSDTNHLLKKGGVLSFTHFPDYFVLQFIVLQIKGRVDKLRNEQTSTDLLSVLSRLGECQLG